MFVDKVFVSENTNCLIKTHKIAVFIAFDTWYLVWWNYLIKQEQSVFLLRLIRLLRLLWLSLLGTEV